MSVPDKVTKMARGNRVPWEKLLLEHLSLSGACPWLRCSPRCPGKPGTRHSCSEAVASGSEEEYRNESCDHAWDSMGLAPPQADVFGLCFSGLSWKIAPSLGSARVSSLYCERGQVLWKSIRSARAFTGAFISDNCSETWMNHVTSAKQ